MQNKIDTENLVYSQLRAYLIEKEEHIRGKGEDWGRKAETVRESLADDIEKL